MCEKVTTVAASRDGPDFAVTQSMKVAGCGDTNASKYNLQLLLWPIAMTTTL